ncbi:hypothetical protein [Pontibacter anaerobius]|uniref:PH domain-containing protein n=1 Tax=Pontibacter anaerobius TaxID=2993940 RepID=A0ABT3RJN0_9BACT|nr:hypothetical protein [Pontibacter anaerobius]MCX2741579.1 hypothetical protein [Pontibacter anaerobius]
MKTIGYSVGIKVFLIVALTAGILLSFWAGLYYIEEGELYLLIAVVLPLFLFCTIGLWYTFKFRLLITEEFIEQQGLLNPTKLYFEQVRHLYLYENEMILKGGGAKIRITSDLQNQREVINHLLQVLNGNPNIELNGDKKAIEAANVKKQIL